MDHDLDAVVRKADPDRWRAARFAADPASRDGLVALYALNDELARVAEQVSTPMIGDIRLAWWREGLEALVAGGPVRAHPVMQALIPVNDRLDIASLEALTAARAADLDPTPFADEPALVGYIDGTAGALMAAAARLLAPETQPWQVASAARAWGWAGLWRAGPALAARGRRWTPGNWGEIEPAELAAHVRHRVADALKAARDELAALPVAAFPAVAYATLAGPYATGRHPGELEKRLRLVAAVARGRI